jgi:hypothetical protein
MLIKVNKSVYFYGLSWIYCMILCLTAFSGLVVGVLAI